MTSERARVYLNVLGQEMLVEADVETGQRPPTALIGLARELANVGLAAARAQSTLAGKPMSCAAGCAHCCRQLIPLTPVEAVALAELVESMPEERRAVIHERLRAARERMVEVGIRKADAPADDPALIGTDPRHPARSAMRRYFEANIACPFLEQERCSIYEQRPVVCREYAVSSAPALCRTLSDNLEALPRPVPTVQALLDLGAEFGTAPLTTIPMPVAVEWVRAHGSALSAAHDVEAMFHALVGRMQAHDDGEPA